MNTNTGAVASKVGAVKFTGFVVSDNRQAGIRFEDTRIVRAYDKAGVFDSIVVASSRNVDSCLAYERVRGRKFRGVWGPRSEWFVVVNTAFIGFDWSNSGALSECTWCRWANPSDSGARTIVTENLVFINVQRKIIHEYPHNGIYHDRDGSLTEI